MELEQYWQFGAALVFVLALIGVLFWIIQRVGMGGGRGRRGSRLGVVEAAIVDKRRRLVLVRRDSTEHLVMIGGPQDVVVESGITRREPQLSSTADRDGEPGLDVRAEVPLAAAAEQRAPAMQTAPEAEPAEVAQPTRMDNIEPPRVEQSAEPAVQPRLEPAAAEAPPQPPQPPQPPVRNEPPVRAEPPRVLDTPSQQQPRVAGRERPAQAEQPHIQAAEQDSPGQHPWPPSEGRFREAQRRFAERNEHGQPPRGGPEPQHEQNYGPQHPGDQRMERRVAGGHDSVPPQENKGDASNEGSPREPANLNVRPGDDR